MSLRLSFEHLPPQSLARMLRAPVTNLLWAAALGGAVIASVLFQALSLRA